MSFKLFMLIGAMTPYASLSWADYLNEAAQAPYEKCGYCHELDGNPRMPRYPRLAGQHENYMIKQLKDFRSGKRTGEMQGTAELLTDTEIQVVAEYFRQQKVRLPELSKQPTKQQQLAKRLYARGDANRGLVACSHCHGPQALGEGETPRLAGQHEQYLLQQLGQFKTKQRKNDTDGLMQANSALLKEAEIAALAGWLARLGPKNGPDL